MDGSSAVDLADPTWRNVDLFYRAGKKPIALEVTRVDEPDSVGAEEVEEFLDLLTEARRGLSRRKVDQHLRRTRFIVAAQLPSDIEDDGYDANGWVMHYFTANHGALVQADGEGFYEGSKLTVRLP